MPFRIQRVPRGLNQLLKIFGGETPIELEDRVRGTIDLGKYYESDIMFGTNAAPVVGALGGVGQTAVLTHTTILECKAIAATVTIGAAAATNVSIAVGVNWPFGSATHLGGIFIPNGAIGQVLRFGVLLPKPLIMTAGSQVIAWASGTAAGADHSVLVTELVNFPTFG